MGGQLVLELAPTSGLQRVTLSTATSYRFDSSELEVKGIALQGTATATVRVLLDSQEFVSFRVDRGLLIPSHWLDGIGPQTAPVITFDPVRHANWKFTFGSTYVIWETAPAGSDQWEQVRAPVPIGFPTTALAVQLELMQTNPAATQQFTVDAVRGTSTP
jgi:hypothetical protein